MLKRSQDTSNGKKSPENSDNGILLNELRKSEANHRLIFQKSALPQLICTQKDLHIIKVNEAAALDLYGYDELDFLQLDIRQLRLPSDRAALDGRVEAALQLEKPPKIYSNTCQEKWSAALSSK
jgi:PAS domain S-box-containing protein